MGTIMNIEADHKSTWSKEPPTEPGWYWVFCNDKKEIAAVRLLTSKSEEWSNFYEGLLVDLIEIQTTLVDFVQHSSLQWQKMNVPHPPKE